MSLLPALTPRKRRLFAASRPNYADYQGPADGDYVRYVEGLMAWAEQEQERQRLQALGDKGGAMSEGMPASRWKPAASAASASSNAAADAYAQPGSVSTAVERFKRKARAQMQKQQAAAETGTSVPRQRQSESTKKNMQASGLVFFLVVMAVAVFATEWLSVVIIAWVVFNVIRAVRAASQSSKS